MSKHAKAPFVLLALLSLLLVPQVARAGDHGAEVQKASVSVMRGDHATISFGADTPVSIELRGKLIDQKTDQPVGRTGIEVVRFEMEMEAGRTPSTISLADANAAAKETFSKETERFGGFKIRDLAPGSYSLQVAWDEVPADADVLVFELSWVKHPLSANEGR